MYVGNNLVQFGRFATVDFLRQGENPPLPAPAGMWLYLNFILRTRFRFELIFKVVSCYFFRQRACSPVNTSVLPGGRAGWPVITWSNLDALPVVDFVH